jgi:transposase
LGVTPATVCKWQARLRDDREGWKRRPLGRPAKCTTKHRAGLERTLPQGAQAHGFPTDLWTLPRIATVWERVAGGGLVHPSHLWRVLGAMGWSVQRPKKRVLQRDEEGITRRQHQTWPALKRRSDEMTAPSSSSTRVD